MVSPFAEVPAGVVRGHYGIRAYAGSVRRSAKVFGEYHLAEELVGVRILLC